VNKGIGLDKNENVSLEVVKMGKTDNITVVIRSANERTEALCLHLVEKQVPSHCITVIRERPFRSALKRSFQIGIEANREWTLCIDADILIRDSAIADLIAFGEEANEGNLGCSGFLFDKFRGGPHTAGLHLYRSKHLSKALSFIAEVSVDARPETYVKKAMDKIGHSWAITRQVLGLHDFEQYYRDIFRKMAVRAYKSANELSPILDRVENFAPIDSDFLVALWGLRIGKASNKIPDLDVEEWRTEVSVLLTAHGVQEKAPLSLMGSERLLVSTLMSREAASKGVSDNKSFTLSSERKVRQLKAMKIKNLVWYIGWLINRFGVKIQRSASD
jgi:hypothetical protein